MRLYLLLLAVAAFSCTANEIDYRIVPDSALRHLTVSVCFKQQVPSALVNAGTQKNRWLSEANDADGKPLKVDAGRMLLKRVKPGDCIDYQVALNAASRNRRGAVNRVGNDVLFDNRVWLWQPESISNDDKVLVHFELPAGTNVSAPWPDAGHRNTFRLTSTPYSWRSRSAIGRFSVHPLTIGKRSLRVAILNSSAQRSQAYLEWIAQAASAVARVGGEFPVDKPQILIVPVGRSKEAVPWGEVQRGGHPAAHFFVDSQRPIEQFKQDWTATHELSHMLVPYIDRKDLFLSEGLASYYQEVARAKAGMLLPEAAWDKLLAGFGRGMGDADRRRLSDTSAIMPMYWGGAAIFLMADKALRELPGKKQSLGSILGRFNHCCRPGDITWSGEALMKKFDELSHSRIFERLYREQAEKRPFPEVKPQLKALGFKTLIRIKEKPLSKEALAIMR